MSPTTILNRQSELEERRLGMRTLDPVEIARHFTRAAQLRALIERESPKLVPAISGTKGACRPQRQ
jgi:hypothetical protein